MCGIAGIIGEAGPDASRIVAAMNALQSYRGPDASCVRAHPGAVLGHNRLSIIDLSTNALQPMESASGRFSVVFNGEIYNFLELRSELETGHVFRSASDTEVLLAAYERWGQGCLDKLNGMFAFCIFDKVERTAFFARDRFGQKPFYYSLKDGCLFFASEVKALLRAGIPAKANLNAWGRYLGASLYDDQDDTFFQDIFQLRAGEAMIFDARSGVKRFIYYDLADKVVRAERSLAQAAEEVRCLLVDIGRIHMRSDVPVGIALSGGFDSSALLAIFELAGCLHNAATGLSVEFEGDLSEAEWMQAAADHHHLNWVLHNYSAREARESFRSMIWHLDGPIGGLSNCAFSTIMAGAQQRGIKVMQDGTGLDEVFAGYRNCHNMYLAQLSDTKDNRFDQALSDYAANWDVSRLEARKSVLSNAGAITSIDGTIPVRPDLLRPDFAVNYACLPVNSAAHSDHPVRDILLGYMQRLRIPRNTRMKDRVSMAFGVELRLPFLDHRLAELAMTMPVDFYFYEGRTKSIVRESLSGAMDDKVRLAAKRSISAPQGRWLMKDPLRGYVKELIGSESFADRKIVDPVAAREAFRQFCAGGADNSFFVWQWINLEEWFRVFIDNDATSKRHPLCSSLSQAQ